MNLSEFGKFGTSFGLIRCPSEKAANEFQSWQNEVLRQWGLELSSKVLFGTVGSATKALLPRTAPIVTRYLFWPLNDQWTLYFDNGANGTDAGPPSILASRLKTDAIRVGMSDEIMDAATGRIRQYGATIFEYYSGDVERRHVFAANDGGKWKFHQSGDPFAFENLDAYKVRSIRDRFTHSMLIRYLSALGVELNGSPSTPTEYGRGFLLTKLGKIPPQFREILD